VNVTKAALYSAYKDNSMIGR